MFERPCTAISTIVTKKMKTPRSPGLHQCHRRDTHEVKHVAETCINPDKAGRARDCQTRQHRLTYRIIVGLAVIHASFQHRLEAWYKTMCRWRFRHCPSYRSSRQATLPRPVVHPIDPLEYHGSREKYKIQERQEKPTCQKWKNQCRMPGYHTLSWGYGSLQAMYNFQEKCVR